MTDLPPVRREVLVPADAATAFEVFTAHLGDWWPLDGFGVYGDGTVALDDGRIVETAADGRTALWGTVTAWEPPHRLAFTWHPGRDASLASRVGVSFTAVEGAQTLVRLTHEGWDVYADPAGTRTMYDGGWVAVLDAYAHRATNGALSG